MPPFTWASPRQGSGNELSGKREIEVAIIYPIPGLRFRSSRLFDHVAVIFARSAEIRRTPLSPPALTRSHRKTRTTTPPADGSCSPLMRGFSCAMCCCIPSGTVQGCVGTSFENCAKLWILVLTPFCRTLACARHNGTRHGGHVYAKFLQPRV